MTKVATTRCAGCQTVLTARRAGSRWCGEPCRKRSERIGDTLGLTEAELGFPPAEYPERSRRFWAGMAALEPHAHVPHFAAPGVLRRLKPSQPPGKGVARNEASEGRRSAANPDKARTHARHERKEQP